jgi:hypothetical protein
MTGWELDYFPDGWKIELNIVSKLEQKSLGLDDEKEARARRSRRVDAVGTVGTTAGKAGAFSTSTFDGSFVGRNGKKKRKMLAKVVSLSHYFDNKKTIYPFIILFFYHPFSSVLFSFNTLSLYSLSFLFHLYQ